MATDSRELGERIIGFCENNLGMQVGSGECAALAFQALRSAGAKTRAGPDYPEPKDYVWGRQVLLIEGRPEGPVTTGDLGDVRPGDIVQYRDTKFARAHFEHHTSVVRKIDPKILTVYQQNVGGVRVVREGSVHIDRLVQGWIRIYRPIPVRD